MFICSPFKKREQKISLWFIFFFLQVRTENPEDSDWKDTPRHCLQLCLRLMRSLQVRATYGYILEMMFWAILLIVRVEKSEQTLGWRGRTGTRQGKRKEAEFKPMSGACVLTAKLMKCSGYVWKWNTSILLTAYCTMFPGCWLVLYLNSVYATVNIQYNNILPELIRACLFNSASGIQ